jgi:hypothetical protein
MNTYESTLRSEWKVIPGWAKALAALLAVCVAVLLNIGLMREANPPPVAFRAFLTVFAPAIIAIFVLMVGYVNSDAGRRSMSRALWTLIVIFVPNALGFILYFLLRKPLLLTCPRCAATVRPDFNFCPKCDCKLAPMCPACSRAVQPGDLFCAHCGADLRSSPLART